MVRRLSILSTFPIRSSSLEWLLEDKGTKEEGIGGERGEKGEEYTCNYLFCRLSQYYLEV